MQTKRVLGLRGRLIALVLIALVPALLLITFTGIEQRRERARDSQQEALRLARLTSSTNDRIIEGARQLLMTLAQFPDVQDARSAACSGRLAAIRSQFPRYSNLGAAAPDGRVVCSAVLMKSPVNIADRPFFKDAIATQGFAIGEYQVGAITGRPGLNFGYPLIDRSGVSRGVVFAALDLGWLNDLARRVHLPAGATLTVLDRTGTILARYPDPDRWVGTSAADTALAAEVGRRGEGVAELPGLDGTRRFYGFTSLLGSSGSPAVTVMVGIPKSTALASVTGLFRKNLLGLGAVAVVALALAWIGGDVLVLRRLRALVAATRRLKRGDLEARSEISHDGSEIGALAESFDEMAEALQQQEQMQARAARTMEAAYERERAAAEKLRELDEMKEAILNHTSHELRTPLTSILGYAMTLQRRDGALDADAQREMLDRLVVNAQRLDKLIADLHDVDRLARGVLAPRYRTANIGDLIRRVAGAMDLDRHEVVIETEEFDAQVDVPKVERIIEHLLSNLARHTPPMTRCWIRAEPYGDGIRISVADDGPGIPASLRENVFHPFHQGALSRPYAPGTGIGLALVSRLAELHNGRAWVEDAPEGGALVRVFLSHGGNVRDAAEDGLEPETVGVATVDSVG